MSFLSYRFHKIQKLNKREFSNFLKSIFDKIQQYLLLGKKKIYNFTKNVWPESRFSKNIVLLQIK